VVALLKAGADPACVDDSDKTGWERALGAQRSTVLARLEGLATKVRKIIKLAQKLGQLQPFLAVFS
jgi:hypothetical protein